MKGIENFSKLREASEDLRPVIFLEIWFSNLQVEEMEASSDGCSHGRISSAHSNKAFGSIVSS